MEVHGTEDYDVLSHGTARVFGYTDARVGWAHELYDDQVQQVLDAEELHTPSGVRDVQTCAIFGVECAFCGDPATAYIRYNCSCCPGGGRDWVCTDCYNC